MKTSQKREEFWETKVLKEHRLILYAEIHPILISSLNSGLWMKTTIHFFFGLVSQKRGQQTASWGLSPTHRLFCTTHELRMVSAFLNGWKRNILWHVKHWMQFKFQCLFPIWPFREEVGWLLPVVQLDKKKNPGKAEFHFSEPEDQYRRRHEDILNKDTKNSPRYAAEEVRSQQHTWLQGSRCSQQQGRARAHSLSLPHSVLGTPSRWYPPPPPAFPLCSLRPCSKPWTFQGCPSPFPTPAAFQSVTANSHSHTSRWYSNSIFLLFLEM